MENKEQEGALVVLPATEVNPASLLEMAVKQDLDIVKLEKLMELQERFQKNQARRNYFEAMSLFQSLVPEITKSKLISFGNTKYKFAPLGEIDAQIKSAMNECGLSKRWELSYPDGNKIECRCVITHKDGHSENTIMQGIGDTSGNKNLIQQSASTITYLQRYTLIAALGLTTADEDNDAQGAQGDSKPTKNEAPAQQDNRPWLNENSKEWQEVEAKLRSNEWTMDDAKKAYKINKNHAPVLQEMIGKPKQSAPVEKNQEPVSTNKEEPSKAEVKKEATKGKPKLTAEDKAEWEQLTKAGSRFVKGEVSENARIYNNNVTAISVKGVPLTMVESAYELDADVRAHYESIKK